MFFDTGLVMSFQLLSSRFSCREPTQQRITAIAVSSTDFPSPTDKWTVSPILVVSAKIPLLFLSDENHELIFLGVNVLGSSRFSLPSRKFEV